MLAGALVAVALLGLTGLHAENRLAAISAVMPGSPSARAESLARRYFGNSAPFAILLRGPAAALNRQGPRLVRMLRDDHGASTLSPWDRGAASELRPDPESALIVADFHNSPEDAATHTVGELDTILKDNVSKPVTVAFSGYASILKGFKDATEDAARRAEMIAIPVLLIVLLLIFRSPVAACIPIFFGIVTVLTSRGVLSLLSHRLRIDPLALPVSSMMGLALGVDYALLMVSRFREEIRAGLRSAEAAEETRRTAGRTIVTAGLTLLSAVTVSLFVVPGPQLTSLFGGVVVATALSIMIAWVVGPAVLTLLGDNVNRWQVGTVSSGGVGWVARIQAILQRPGLVTLTIVGAMLILAAPALGMKIGAISVNSLPKDSEVRRNAAVLSHRVGPGWTAPFILVMASEAGTITDPKRFAAVERWESRLTHDPSVHSVIGPTRVVRRVRPLRRAGDRLVSGNRPNPGSRLRRLGAGLGRASSGVSRLRSGLAQASAGAGLLGDGSERAASGAATISEGVHRVVVGNERVTGALAKLAAGSRKLANGQSAARLGASQLELGLDELLPTVAGKGLGAARALRAELEREVVAQPELSDRVSEASQLVTDLVRAKAEVRQLRKVAVKEHLGLTQLATGGSKLQKGTAQLLSGSEGATAGLAGLDQGSRRLAGGLTRLGGGARSLQRNLADGFHLSRPLQSRLRRTGAGVSAEGRGLGHRIDKLRSSSPGLFDSGHFVLSALAGASPSRRESIDQVVNLERGGQAARLIVVPESAPSSTESIRLYDQLRREAAWLGARSGLSIGVNGGIPQQVDYTRVTAGRLPLLALGISVTTFLILVLFMRALLLPALAVVLNLGTVAVAFGILVLLGELPQGLPFGNGGTLNVVTVMAVFSLAFALSIDYAVFLTMRMRERYDRTGDHAEAVIFGLGRTARVITGAAAIMGAVFITYAAASFEFLSQIGTGLTIAVLLDATIVRIILLPALMLVFGRRVWWLPAAIERRLPRLDPHGADLGRAPAGVVPELP